MLLLLLALLSSAGDITLNGADIGSLRGQSFKGVDVHIDEHGNVHLTSDRYAVQVQPGAPSSDTVPPPVPTPSAVNAGATPASVVSPDRSAGAGDWSQSRPAIMSNQQAAIQAGSWWLATTDKGSVGHEVRVYVNGALVKTVRSGDDPVVLDIARHLKHGANDVMVQSRSSNPAGGALYVYLGEGSNESGTVTLSKPQLQHALGPSRRGDDVREYVLRVP